MDKVRYCDKVMCNSTSNEGIVIETRFSYPRFYSRTNAYLIKDKRECLRVQEKFVLEIADEIGFIQDIVKNKKFELLDWIKQNVKIKITRVDVPFTYMMEEKENFNSYQNVYRILEEVFKVKNKRYIPKEIKGNHEIQTLILCNSSNPNNYNSKLTIYNQAQKFKDYYQDKDPDMLESIYKENLDLDSRIRMEVSKRINRKAFTLKEFEDFDIYTEYVESYANYILDNIFDDKVLEKIKEQQITLLKEKLIMERKKNNFNYENFIFYNQDIIYDWELLRRAIMETSSNENSGYQGTSTAKKILKKLEQDRDVIYFGVFKKIADMKKKISKYCKGGK